MLWSNSDRSGYCVGIAKSKNGKPDGKWTQSTTPFFSKTLGTTYDGGHGMLFTLNGQLYLSVHSPNSAVGTRTETPVFLPLREENNTLVWDVYRP